MIAPSSRKRGVLSRVEESAVDKRSKCLGCGASFNIASPTEVGPAIALLTVLGVFCCSILCTAPLAGAEDARLGPANHEPPSGMADANAYCHIRIVGVLGKDFTAADMKAKLAEAERTGTNLVVVELDTPGGSVADAEKIVDLMIACPKLRFVALVQRALSAGAAIALACPEIYVSERATIGAAVSYVSDRQGAIVVYPEDIAEKRQSAWRAVCRKAAEHGKHDSLIAEAMVDKDFALTTRKEDGKAIFERDGQGQIVKAKGRILTLTGREAVLFSIAKDMVVDMAALGQMLGMQGWRETSRNQATEALPESATIESDPGKLYAAVSQKVEALRPAAEASTELQRKLAKDELTKWIGANLVGRQVKWKLTMVDVGPLPDDVLSDARHLLAELSATRNPSAEMAQAIRELTETIEYSTRVQGKVSSLPCLVILAFVNGKSQGYLAGIRKEGEFTVAGRIREVSPIPDASGEFRLRVILARSSAPGEEDQLNPVTPRKTKGPPARTREELATEQLGLAKAYRSAGMAKRAKEVLEGIVRDYAETEAAKKAKIALILE